MQRLNQSPTAPEFVQDPYRFYGEARATGSVFFWTDYDLACVTSHDVVSQVLRHPDMGREKPAELVQSVPIHLKPFYRVEAHSMLELEGQRHRRLRGLVLRAFTSRRIAGLEPELEQLCFDLIERFPAGKFDLISAYAKWVPVIVICRLLGVPEEHAEQLLLWSNAMVGMYQAGRTRVMEDNAARAASEFSAFINEFIEVKRARPTDDLISELIAAEDDGHRLSREEMVTTCILLLNAGHEATVHTIGNGVATLLRSDHRRIDAATIEEILRFDPPLHMFTRWVYRDVEIAGHRFKRGEQIACLLAAANRDPSVYPDPDTFRPERVGPTQTSFGAGPHFCVGAPLARLELLVALRTLFARCPDLTLAEPPKYANLYHFHGFRNLFVKL